MKEHDKLSGLWPREKPRYTESHAEPKVYNSLKANLPKGWYAWHSLGLHKEDTGEFGETDFVIAIPNRPAILLVEVKGGRIEQHDGKWFQNNKPVSPLNQAHTFRKKLETRLKEKGLVRAERPQIGLCFCFPDTIFSNQPTQDGMNGVTIGKESLPYLDKIFRDIVRRTVPNPAPVRGNEWIKILHEIWGESWVPELDLCCRIKYDESECLKLDQRQLEIIDNIDETNERVLIKGTAGTGKTLLARELTLRMTKLGYRVLLLCFTDALGIFFKENIVHPNIEASSIRRFALEQLRKFGEIVTEIDSSEFWDSLPLRAAVDGLQSEKNIWDFVIVDEGQDFSEDDWVLVEECSRKTNRIWVFADQDQAFWTDRKIPEIKQQKWFRYNLNKPYRCPPAIQNLSECYAGSCELNLSMVEEAINENVIRVVSSSEQKLISNIEYEIEKLIDSGLQPHEIAIISVRGKSEVKNIMHKKKIGARKIVPATDANADSQIICDTFLRFKGLQRPAVIVTDLRLVSSFYEKRMYMAISRAQSLLRIVSRDAEIRNDSRLANLTLI
ncbi:NERD domain-containing protein [Thermodesulfobacteriota bacterium]